MLLKRNKEFKNKTTPVLLTTSKMDIFLYVMPLI